jgi:(S)-ureidoglycine aminohydrolase
MSIPGESRTRIRERHALIAPDGRVSSVVPGVTNATPYLLISPEMGANLTQLLVAFDEGGRIEWELEDVETFCFVLTGECAVRIGEESEVLEAGGYVFAPAGERLEVFRSGPGTNVLLFQKLYEEVKGQEQPQAVFGNADEIVGAPFLGDPDAVLKTLLPETSAFDMAVNLFTFQPGARLPFVETHVMEHGLMMLTGEGVYRLEDAWYPVAAGDAIWMAPFCPQWFVAMGKQPAIYLYYKDVNRHSLP